MRVTALVPAFNEAPRVSPILRLLVSSHRVKRVMLIDDGSTDQTAGVGEGVEGVEVMVLPENLGKAGAIERGLATVDEGIILLLDADLIGFSTDHLNQLLDPLEKGHCEMSVGVFLEGKLSTDLGQVVAPGLSGQRAFLASRFQGFPLGEVKGYGFETALNGFALSEGWRTLRIPLVGVHQVTKEKKRGVVKGLGERLLMYWEVALGWMGRWTAK
ncbi:glycosyltransferase [bacterium]|nr:glycosyltransferase [bacterium]